MLKNRHGTPAALVVCWVPIVLDRRSLSSEPSDWSRGYVDLLLGEIGNILERGSGVVVSLRRGLVSLRNGVEILLTRDDVIRQE